jgi:hypothetical protein
VNVERRDRVDVGSLLGISNLGTVVVDADNPADAVDPTLIRRFAVFREAASSDALDAQHAAAVEKVVSTRGARRLGLIASLARAVRVNPSLTVVAVPGSNGVLLLVPGSDGRTAGFGAIVQSVLLGQTIGSAGPLVFGMAQDGVTDQSVELRDGSRITAPVVHNVYAVEDKSWRPPVFADD